MKSRIFKLALSLSAIALTTTAVIAACDDTPVRRVGTLMRAGTGNDWDTTIREIGNVLHHNGKYYFYYSGHRGKNYRGKNDIYVGVAVSDDGRKFTKLGKALDLPAEDPYVNFKQGVFYMFYEDKTEVPDLHTSLATSKDGIHFTRVKFGFLAPTKGKDWQSTSASSPIALVEGKDITLLYEGYGWLPDGRKNQGQIGIYRRGVQQSRPVYVGSGDPSQYDEFVATDDITKVGDWYFMSYHSLQAGVRWTAAVSMSNDLLHWTRPSQAHFDTRNPDMTVMFHKIEGENCYRYLMSDGKSVGIYSNTSLNGIGLPSCAK